MKKRTPKASSRKSGFDVEISALILLGQRGVAPHIRLNNPNVSMRIESSIFVAPGLGIRERLIYAWRVFRALRDDEQSPSVILPPQ